jgi:class 3 adenylate cyclase/tetratricopeptide (TPR) repeat protein
VSARLQPYVARLAMGWALEAPDARHKELEGSLVFADISGFTHLSERLARRGPVGAEELVGIINACFGELLPAAYEQGAGLLKFGGDALLLLVQGQEHAARACVAAFEMRRRLGQFTRSTSMSEAAHLRISIGVHSARFNFFLVGGSHRELLVTGPGATQTVACESAADAGEILLSRSTAAAVESRAIGSDKAPGHLLRSAPFVEHAAAIEVPPSVAGLDLEMLVPAGLREYIQDGVIEPEHRDASVAFIRFSGVDQMLTSDGPDAVAEAVEHIVRSTQNAVEEEGITFLESDIAADGGKLYLAAGAPRASDRDEEKLLRAVRAIADARSALPLSIGVNRGHVFSGLIGTAFRQTYSVMGDPVNLAARLSARAQTGEVIATPAVLDRSRTIFHLERLEPFLVKGKREPITAYLVGAVEGVRQARVEPGLPIVGRDRELMLLQSTVGAARAGRGDLLELVGEAGMGKSRLVLELRALATEMQTLTVECEPYEASTPYFAIRGLLRNLLDVELGDDPAINTARLSERLSGPAPEMIPWLPLLAIPLDRPARPTREADEVDPIFRRARVHAVVRTLLTKILTGPTVLIFEDAHWMDEASAELVRHLGEHVHSRPWLLCITRRPESTGFAVLAGTHAITIQLTPLTASASAELAGAAAAESSLTEKELTVLAARAAGNPLFLRELIVASTRAGLAAGLPESVQAVIAARIDRLGSADRTVLRYASVLGPTFQQDIVSLTLNGYGGIARDPATWDRLAAFIDVDLDGTCRFKHALFREVAYEGLSFERRRQIHRRVGEVYEARLAERVDDVAELLSLHFSLAGVIDKAWRYSVTAGDRARSKHANLEAADFYRRALEAGRRLPADEQEALARVWESLGDVCELAARYEEATRAYQESRRLRPSVSPEQLQLLRKEGVLRERQGKYADALRWYGRALRALERALTNNERTRHQVQLSLAYAGVRYRQGRFRQSVRWAEEARRLATTIDDRPGLAHAYYLLHLAHTTLGSHERAQYRALALEFNEELGDLVKLSNFLNNLGMDAYYEGRWDEALKFYERGGETRERAGDVVGAATSLNNIAEIKSDQGHLEEAEALFKRAQAITQAAGYRLLPVVTTGNLGRLAARAGRFEEAGVLLAGALQGFEALGAKSFVLETRARQAELALLSGDSVAALRLGSEALSLAAREGDSPSLHAMLERVRGWAWIQQEDYEAAAGALERSETAARAEDARYEVALTLQAQAFLARVTAQRVDAIEVESQRLLSALGVVSTPAVPIEVRSP